MTYNLDWLKEEVYSLMPDHTEMYNYPDYDTILIVELLDKVLELIKKLEKQENVDWTKEEIIEKHGMTQSEWDEVISRYKWHLKKEGYIIVEKPIIPKNVAEWVDRRKGLPTLSSFLEYFNSDYKDNQYLFNWVESFRGALVNKFPKAIAEDILANVYRYGYQIKEDKKYRVIDGNITLLGKVNESILTTVEIVEYYPEYIPVFELTEEEIKNFNEKYWSFAEPVEEN